MWKAAWAAGARDEAAWHAVAAHVRDEEWTLAQCWAPCASVAAYKAQLRVRRVQGLGPEFGVTGLVSRAELRSVR